MAKNPLLETHRLMAKNNARDERNFVDPAEFKKNGYTSMLYNAKGEAKIFRGEQAESDALESGEWFSEPPKPKKTRAAAKTEG